jgi:hypothetical protein
VRRWRGGQLGAAEVLQQCVPGRSCSAVAVADGRSAALLSTTEQLVGEGDFGGHGYQWCGNLVPPRLAPHAGCTLLHQAREICQYLAGEFGLRGCFAVDLIWDGRTAWVVEVNPRPPGSLEAIELAGYRGCLEAHVRAFDDVLPSQAPPDARLSRAAAKAIVYASGHVHVGETPQWFARGIRDIPYPGQRITAGHPMCTVRGVGTTPDDALQAVRRQAVGVRKLLSTWTVRGVAA